MASDQLLLVAAASASLSALVTWVAKTYVQHRLNLQLQAEVEALKSALARQDDETKKALEMRFRQREERLRKRLEVYPRVMEVAYRIRNCARQATLLYPQLDRGACDEFGKNLRGLEEMLYQERFYFETDGSMSAIHRFKNGAVLFHVLLGDILHLLNCGDRAGSQLRHCEAELAYAQLDDLQCCLNRMVMRVMGDAWSPAASSDDGGVAVVE